MINVRQINETWDTPWIQYSISAAASARSQQLPLVQEHKLRGLVANSEYHLTMRARNSYGECELTEEFRFRTASGMNEQVHYAFIPFVFESWMTPS